MNYGLLVSECKLAERSAIRQANRIALCDKREARYAGSHDSAMCPVSCRLTGGILSYAFSVRGMTTTAGQPAGSWRLRQVALGRVDSHFMAARLSKCASAYLDRQTRNSDLI